MNYSSFFIGLLFVSCVEDMEHRDVDVVSQIPDLANKTEITFQQLFNLHSNVIGKDTLVSGYVISSDAEGNFFKEIYVQNTTDVVDSGEDNPRMGLKIRVGLNPTSTKYGKGRKISVNLEGLKKTTSDNVLTIGQPSTTFIKDILEFDLDDHIYKIDEVREIEPKVVALSALGKNDLNTWVKINNLHFTNNTIGNPLAGLATDEFDGERILEFCNNIQRDTVILETSNFSNFASELIPNKQVVVQGVYTINFDDNPVLILNQFSDIALLGAYVSCPEINTPNVLITEVADPKVGTGEKARYVELYNPTENVVSLDGWSLIRYNKTISNENKLMISLNGNTIAAKSTLIVASNSENSVTQKTWFETYFNFPPNITSTSVDGNGDDAYELVDSLDEVKDIYGIPNVDGTDSVWDYENGVAIRKETIVQPNKLFVADEWEVKSELPKLIIGDFDDEFTPGVR